MNVEIEVHVNGCFVNAYSTGELLGSFDTLEEAREFCQEYGYTIKVEH